MTDAERTDDRSLQDRAYDLLGEMLIEQDTEQFLRELEEKQASGDTADIDTFSRRKDENNLKKIAAYTRKQRRRRLVRRTLPKIGQIAAVVVAVFFLAGSVAVAASHTVRVKVMELLINIEREYTTITLVEDETASFDVPAAWKGSSYPAYIPEGMEIEQIADLKNACFVTYHETKHPTKKISYDEFGTGSVTNIDTENADVRMIRISGYWGYLVTKNETVQIFWTDGVRYYVVSSKQLGEEETIAFAQNIRKIN